MTKPPMGGMWRPFYVAPATALSLETQDALWDCWTYLRDCAGVNDVVVRDKGVPPARLAAMRERLDSLRQRDREAYYVVVTEDYAQTAAGAMVTLVRRYVEDRAGLRDDSTDPVLAPPVGGEGDP